MRKSRFICLVMTLVLLVSLVIPSGIAADTANRKDEAKAKLSATAEDVTAGLDATAKLTVKVKGSSGKVTYQWYESTNGKKFTKSAEKGSKKATLQVKVTAETYGMVYRCTVKDAKSSVDSNVVRIKAPFTVSVTPTSAEAAVGKKVSFKASAKGTSGTVQYVWQTSTDGGETWKNSSKKKATLSIKVTGDVYATQYRCVITAGKKKMATQAVYVNPVDAKDYTFTESGNGWAIKKYKGKKTELTLPSGYKGKAVTAVGKAAFKNSKTLKKVTLPKSYLKIDESAFEGCKALTTVTLSDNVNEIGKAAFKNCTKLSAMNISNK